MDMASRFEAYKYFCQCNQVYLDRVNLIAHLQKISVHRISKVIDPSESLEDINDTFLNRIDGIVKAQIQIQQSSNQLIQSINQNTSKIIIKLSDLIKVFKDLILNHPKEKLNEIKKFEIVNIFETNNSLCSVLINHFQQKPVAEKSTYETIRKKIKSQVLGLFKNHLRTMKCMAVLSNEKGVVTGGADGAIRIWNLESNLQTWFIIKHKGGVLSLALGNKDGLMLSGSGDTTVRLWNLDLKRQLNKFEGHTKPVTSVLISRNNETGYSGSLDKTIRIWNLKLLSLEKKIDFKTSIWQINLINEEKVISTAQMRGIVSFFNLYSSKLIKLSAHHNSDNICICFSQDEERFITGREDGTIEVWQSQSNERIFNQKKHSGKVKSISIFSNYFATGSQDHTVIIWDIQKLCLLKILKYGSAITSIFFSKTSELLFICCAFHINIYDPKTFKSEEKIDGKPLNQIDVSLDLKYLAYGYNKVHLFDLKFNKKLSKSILLNKIIFYIKFSPNSAFVAAGFFVGEIIILHIPNLVVYKIFSEDLQRIACLSFSKNNKYLGFSDSESKVMIKSIETRETSYKKEGIAVNSLIFCPNNDKFFYTRNKSIYVLDKEFTQETMIKFSGFVNNITTSEDNNFILVNYNGYQWYIVKLENLEKIFENESREKAKEWCDRRKDLKLKIFLSHLAFFSN